MYYNLDINPEPWRIGPLSVGRNKKSGGMFAQVGRDQQLHAYKQAVKEQLSLYDTFMVPGLFEARYYFWRRQDSYTTQRQVEHRKHEADLTNLTKATEDACQGVLFGNDRDCVGIENYLFEQGPNVRERVIVGVSPVGAREDPVVKLGR
ncbi:RusA family crossover junction endodeoxyribonuclease, partial [Streptomyces solisilvae]|uniref:RusA family crossover junction endodeoxyribonuclease n=2 Tax=Streptomyces TaxID=1883 RepID=UPI003678F3FE